MSKTHPSFWVAAILIAGLFLFTRTYRLTSTFLLYGDAGRDLMVLDQWFVTHKTPLLGPQTSALPFNQSAVYFYLLMPFYLLSGRSPYASSLAYVSVYLIVAGLISWLILLRPKLLKVFLVTFLLICIQPQYILQGRYIWNPSFVPICILTAYFAYTFKRWWLLGFSLALATGFSYSVVPVMLAFWLMVRKFKLILTSIIGLLLVNLPTFVFDFRHGFLLTKMMLFGQKIPQAHTGIGEKLTQLAGWFIGGDSLILGLLFLAILALGIWFDRRRRGVGELVLLIMVSLVLSLILPLSFHAHYVFGLFTLLFILIGLLSIRHTLALLIITGYLWLSPTAINSYLKPAPRTVAQTVSCIQAFCQKYSIKTYVSTQSSYHAQHDAPEYRYLFNRWGCRATDITLPGFNTGYMAVIVEDSTYEHGKTAYNELTLFGPSVDTATFVCQPNLSIHLLKKI